MSLLLLELFPRLAVLPAVLADGFRVAFFFETFLAIPVPKQLYPVPLQGTGSPPAPNKYILAENHLPHKGGSAGSIDFGGEVLDNK